MPCCVAGARGSAKVAFPLVVQKRKTLQGLMDFVEKEFSGLWHLWRTANRGNLYPPCCEGVAIHYSFTLSSPLI